MARKAKVIKETEHKEDIMTELNIKTICDLVQKDNKEFGDIKRMIENYGVYYLNRWEEWEAAPKNLSSSDQIINGAISALGDYADIYYTRVSNEELANYYSDPTVPRITRYGFNQDENGKLFVKKTPIQTLEEQIEILKEDNKRLGGVCEPQVDKELVAPELELANQLYQEALKKRDPKTNKVEGKTPREWMLATLVKMDLRLEDPAMKRIASVANWDKKQTNKSKK
jgi:hypothetical protein